MPITINLDDLDYATLKKLASDATSKANEKKQNELRVLVNDWKQKADQCEFSISDVLKEFKLHLPEPETGRKSSMKVPTSKEKGYTSGVSYKDPDSKDQWTGGSKGPRPIWLKKLIPTSMPVDKQIEKYAELVVK